MAVVETCSTPFTELVGCRLPLQMAVLGGGVGSVELAAAVSNAGALGMLPQWAPESADQRLARMQILTAAPFGMGFFAFDVDAQGIVFDDAARTARVVDVFWGDPDLDVVARIHDGGALAFWQVGSRNEALAAAAAGCDAVVAQGVEAGGHVRGITPLLELLAQVVPAVDVPVVAAAGISTGRAMAAAMRAGASAVRVGTRLVATAESGAHPRYVDALLRACGESDTVLCTAFTTAGRARPIACCVTACRRASSTTATSSVPSTWAVSVSTCRAGPCSHLCAQSQATSTPWPCTPAPASVTSTTRHLRRRWWRVWSARPAGSSECPAEADRNQQSDSTHSRSDTASTTGRRWYDCPDLGRNT